MVSGKVSVPNTVFFWWYRHAVDNAKAFAALLTDLSKAFECVRHDLLIAKLNAYGLLLSALKFVHNYCQRRKQRTKNGIAYSLWEQIAPRVPLALTLGPLLFNIFLCNLFWSTETNYFTNYVDDTTPYVIGNDLGEVVSELKSIKWALNNKINRLHERCLRIVYNQKRCTFNEFLEIFSMHAIKTFSSSSNWDF